MHALLLALIPAVAPAAEPPVSAADLARFPPEVVVNDLDTLAADRRDWIEHQQQFHPEDPAGWQHLHEDQCWRASCWRALLRCHWNASGWDGSTSYQIQSLIELRALIGAQAYYAGTMPSPVNLDALDIR